MPYAPGPGSESSAVFTGGNAAFPFSSPAAAKVHRYDGESERTDLTVRAMSTYQFVVFTAEKLLFEELLTAAGHGLLPREHHIATSLLQEQRCSSASREGNDALVGADRSQNRTQWLIEAVLLSALRGGWGWCLRCSQEEDPGEPEVSFTAQRERTTRAEKSMTMRSPAGMASRCVLTSVGLRAICVVERVVCTRPHANILCAHN